MMLPAKQGHREQIKETQTLDNETNANGEKNYKQEKQCNISPTLPNGRSTTVLVRVMLTELCNIDGIVHQIVDHLSVIIDHGAMIVDG